MNNFYALLFRQKYITRWGLMRNTQSESLSEHAMEVAVIAHALCVIGNTYFGKNYNADRATTIAVFHDAPEVFTGDLPTPIKYFSKQTKEHYTEIEDIFIDKYISNLPKEMQKTYLPILSQKEEDTELLRMVKIADKICAYVKCIEECESGNRDFTSAKKATEDALNKMKCPELDFFMEHFIKSFSLNIDEI